MSAPTVPPLPDFKLPDVQDFAVRGSPFVSYRSRDDFAPRVMLALTMMGLYGFLLGAGLVALLWWLSS